MKASQPRSRRPTAVSCIMIIEAAMCAAEGGSVLPAAAGSAMWMESRETVGEPIAAVTHCPALEGMCQETAVKIPPKKTARIDLFLADARKKRPVGA